MTNRKKGILRTLGLIGLIYSVLGISLHSLYKLHLIGHYCDTLLLGLQESHLVIFTITSGFTATIFGLLKSKKRRKKIRIPY